MGSSRNSTAVALPPELELTRDPRLPFQCCCLYCLLLRPVQSNHRFLPPAPSSPLQFSEPRNVWHRPRYLRLWTSGSPSWPALKPGGSQARRAGGSCPVAPRERTSLLQTPAQRPAQPGPSRMCPYSTVLSRSLAGGVTISATCRGQASGVGQGGGGEGMVVGRGQL